jgi:CRP-like cAMP-binding protein
VRKLSNRETTILEAMDAEIEELAKKLEKVQPLVDELQRLRRARSVMLDEKSLTGKPRSGGRSGNTGAQMETVIAYLREHGEASTTELADYVGTTVASIRTHLNRYRDERYRQTSDGNWALIGADADDPEEEDDDD